MSKISAADIRKLAHLSRLKLSENEVTKFQTELSAILEYVEILKEVEVSGLGPTSQVTGLQDVVREDVKIDYGTNQTDLLKNAPALEQKQFKVKRMIG
jgi:aspartyl-tRNA(Asn)/glutamyl-tRNA(Gln) amidotransferase subunit C